MDEEHRSALLAIAQHFRLVRADAVRLARGLKEAPEYLTDSLYRVADLALIEAHKLEAEAE